ncbi:MAG: hypothetical protein WEE89_00230 [Gemmatimonadota bacterium]
MRTRKLILLAGLLALTAPVALTAQNTTDAKGTTGGTDGAKPAPTLLEPALVIQHMRPQDKRGLNMFESPKENTIPFTGFRLDWGAAFTQQFQGLDHSNGATAVVKKDATGKDYNANQLITMGNGFNNASANLNLNAQLAPGIRVALTTYLSSRHHNEAWVKDGYLLIDESPIDFEPLNILMQYLTVKVGHFEINYGDAHFRRSDNGNALYNPFVGNLIMDAFTTEVGSEIYVRAKGFMAMAAMTGGEIKGNILSPDDRSPAWIFKLGYDKQITDDVRVRLTGSHYQISRSPANTLFAGDRAGSRYWYVLENTIATSTAQASSGLINPGFRAKVDAMMINPFIKVKGLELFGVIEKAEGRAATETATREWKQYAVDGVYRFGGNESFFAGARYNTAEGTLNGIANEVSVDRYQLGAGWFLTPTVVLKGEYVNQKYNDFPLTDIRNRGKFNGLVFEGIVAF